MARRGGVGSLGQGGVMGTLLDDIDEGAAWIAQALTASGYRADGSPASLWEVDRFLDDHTAGGKPRPGGLLAEAFGFRTFCLGAYVGEVVRTGVGGAWHTDDDDPRGELDAELHLTGGRVVWPMQRVLKRVTHGPEDGVAAYGALLGLEVGSQPAPARARRRWFDRR